MRLPHGERGKIVDIREFSRDEGHELLPGVNRLIRVSVAAKPLLRSWQPLHSRVSVDRKRNKVS